MKTNETLFHSKEDVPDKLSLKNVLGVVYPAYNEILTMTGDYQQEWKFYGARIGWQLKATRKGKALFYLTPQAGSFGLAFAVRDQERDMLLGSKLPAKIKEELRIAKRYPEGYPLRLQIKKESDMNVARLVVDTLNSQRS